MRLLIDGYNLLHATDICGEGAGAGSFQRSREALLAFLAASLDQKERAQTTIVFDAAEAPPNLPAHYVVERMTVHYARDYPDADAMIEDLIEAHPAPRRLLVVSSDHRVQRAARRRGGKRIDSDQWYAELWQRRMELRRQQQKSIPEKPIGDLSSAEISYWVKQFGGDDLPELAERKQDPPDERPSSFENPFPPGYADDLFDSDFEI